MESGLLSQTVSGYSTVESWLLSKLSDIVQLWNQGCRVRLSGIAQPWGQG